MVAHDSIVCWSTSVPKWQQELTGKMLLRRVIDRIQVSARKRGAPIGDKKRAVSKFQATWSRKDPRLLGLAEPCSMMRGKAVLPLGGM